ncbi:MAG: hypothetical protein BroJett018_27510 [Chloroflexota bacterium]|nr:MAG: hypothetical protein BroJett018_27510 [Chloroflexota bacterium]
MKIVGIKVENYKSFLETEWIEFGSGFNAIIGKNNVGKTALLEAISTKITPKPHISRKTKPVSHRILNPTSIVHIIFEFSGAEIIDGLVRDQRQTGQTQYFPFPITRNDQQIKDFINHFHLQASIKIEAIFRSGADTKEAFFQQFVPMDDRVLVGNGRLHPTDNLLEFLGTGGNDKNFSHNSLIYISNVMRNRIYSFKAERLNIGIAPNQAVEELEPNANNLPSVLHTLQLNYKYRFERYLEAVRLVFPDIQQISVPQVTTNTSQVEIKVWEIDPFDDRGDLAMPLSECGTGISQVLAMLHVVLNSDVPRVIVIDEPQSFLHPGAIRTLFDIFRLKTFGGRPVPEHQYIISTHSPVAITAANPSTIFLVTKEGAESKVEPIDINETNQVRLYLQEIGASLSDVFGAEQILWVEGKTEEQCFPLILIGICQRQLFGTAIVGLLHTGDFRNKKDRRLALQVYERLSKARGILPPAIGFMFDKEELDADDMREFEKIGEQFNAPVYFSSRRMYENYLLNSAAICSALTSFGLGVTVESVEEWIEQNRWSTKYIRIPKSERSLESWLKHVDGAELLKSLFRQFSESTYEYDKVVHGIQLTEWLIENCPEDLRDVADMLIKALKLDKD